MPYSPFQKTETLESWHNWLLSNWSRLLNWKRPETKYHSSKLLKGFLKIIVLIYIYKSVNFGDLMSGGSKYTKMHPVSCTDSHHHDVINLVNPGKVKNIKTCISWERNIAFLRNKKFLTCVSVVLIL